jgi:hypothetical protein
MRVDKVKRLLNVLREAGLIDETEQGLAPHNWDGRQYKSDVSTPRVRALRERRGNVSETPPEYTDTEVTDTDTESKISDTTYPHPSSDGSGYEKSSQTTKKKQKPTINGGANGHNGHREYPDQFMWLWSEYQPIAIKTSSKRAAFVSWNKLSQQDRDACWLGVVKYADWLVDERRKKPDYPVKHLATFINQRCWEPFLETMQEGEIAYAITLRGS